MEFIKRQLFLILCGVVGLIGLGLAGWGMTNKTIMADMETGAALTTQLNRYMKGPVLEGAETALPPINQQAIQHLEKKIETIQRYYGQVLEKVKEINHRDMLLADVFPRPRNTSAPFNFLQAYRKALYALPSTLNEGREVTRGEVPTAREVDVVQAMMEERLRQESAHLVGLRDDDKQSTDRSAEAQRAADLASLSPEELVSREPRAQACVMRARSINTYMSRSALHTSPIINVDTPPSPEEMWHAQMTYIVQKDVINAVKAINKAAADELESKQESPWVGNLPVKDVRQIIVGGNGWQGLYVIGEEPESGGSSRRSFTPRPLSSDGKSEKFQPPPMGPNDVFTKRASSNEYDVIRFALHLIVDERDIPDVLSGISKANFYVPLTVSYRAVLPEPLFQGKVYGSEPVVLLSVDFEGYFFRDNYKDLMPKGIKDLLGVTDQPM